MCDMSLLPPPEPKRLFRTTYFNHTSSTESEQENGMSIFLRLRPNPNRSEVEPYKIVDNMIETESATDAKSTVEKQFKFSKIFETTASQKMIYDMVIYPSVRTVLDSPGATFMTYGTSGSGKTFTLIGDIEHPGIIPRALHQLYSQFGDVLMNKPYWKTDFRNGRETTLYEDEIRRELELTQLVTTQSKEARESNKRILEVIETENSFEPLTDDSLRSVTCYVSFIEVYKEQVKDLLEIYPDAKLIPKIVSNGGESFVSNAQWIFAPTALDCIAALQYGLQLAHFGDTNVNRSSSRAHMIFTVNLIATFKDDTIQRSTLKFCDLAGSERTKKTNAGGSQLAEANKINKSLTTLGRCLQIIHNNQSVTQASRNEVVPVRESKVTRLIQSALLGREKLSIIVNLMPSKRFKDENLNVLSFAAVAKKIVVQQENLMRPQRRQSSVAFPTLHASSFNSTSDSLMNEVTLLRRQNEELQRLLVTQEIDLREDLVNHFSQVGKNNERFWEQKLATAEERAKRHHERQISYLEERYEKIIMDLEEELDFVKAKYRKLKKQLGDVSSPQVAESESETDSESNLVIEIED